MKIRLALFVGICFLGMVVVIIGCSPLTTEQQRVSPADLLKIMGYNNVLTVEKSQ